MPIGAASRMITGLGAALALFASSAANAAPVSASDASNAWLVLTDLSASQTAAHDCKNNSQHGNEKEHRCKAPSPPFTGSAGGMADGTGPIFVMGLWWGLIALALASGDNRDHANSPG